MNKKNLFLLESGLNKPFKFDPALATFTPSMAKRNSAAPFAAGVMVQGNMDGSAGDVLTCLSGNTVKYYFYSNFDSYQGSCVFWITPEWNGNDGLDHRIFRNTNLIIYHHMNNMLYVHVGNQNAGLDISSWVAGTTYCVVIRWDSKNTLDGTNTIGISINDAHTFLVGVTPTLSALSTTQSIGVNTVENYQANAIIEGFTIYRRVLFDGTYGKDVGNGDELALIYNAGTGKDPTEITGSWDVVFCLPTNATAGALVTGTGEAWSHPHSSNVLKDGWLADGYYGGGDYAVDLTAVTRYISVSSDASISNLFSASTTIEMWIKFPSSFTDYTYLCYKGNESSNGFRGYIEGGNLSFYVYSADSYAAFAQSMSTYVTDSWHHIAITFENGGDRKLYLYIDGKYKKASSALTGLDSDDSSSSLVFGRTSARASYVFGWTRISNSIRYTTDFVPSRTPPAVDGNTVGQWNMTEGTGTTVDNAEGTAAIDGTITNGTWTPVWKPSGSPIVPTSVAFNGTTTSISVADAASIQDLQDSAFTAEGWFRAYSTGEGGYGSLLDKRSSSNGWFFRFNGGNSVGVQVYCATSNASISATFIPDGKWHHWAMTFDDGGDRKVRLYLDRILIGTSPAGVGTINSDVGIPFNVGSEVGAASFDGAIGWVRLSNVVRDIATETYTRVTPPDPADANTMLQFNMTEGAGTAIADGSGEGNNGTLSNGTWNNTPEMAIDSPGARTFNWGHVFGSDAADEGIEQRIDGATAGADYVLRALLYSEDGIGQPKVQIWDNTNDAEIKTIKGDWSRERIANGGFDSDTLWNKGTGWSIGAGVASCDGSQTDYSTLNQVISYQINGGIVQGVMYKIVFTLSGHSAGSVSVRPGYSGDYSNSISVDGTYTFYIICVNSTTTFYIRADADFIGSIDDVSVTPVSEESKPDVLMCSFELPTVARAGSAADCTSFSIRLLNEAADGVVGWNQVELLPNLLDNPSFEYGAVADPWIPDGWTNNDLDSGDSVKESSITHSQGSSIKFEASASSSEKIESSEFLTSLNKYFGFGGYTLTDGISGAILGTNSLLYTQITLNSPVSMTSILNGWRHLHSVVRGGYGFRYRVFGNGRANLFADDIYAIALDDVSLTATPASLANSQESGGIRVDGRDTLTQPVTKLKATKGEIRFNITPRHSTGKLTSFGNSSCFLLRIVNGARYISLSASDLTALGFDSYNGVGWLSGTYNDMSWVAGTTYSIKLKYTSSSVRVYVNNVLVINLTGVVDLGAGVLQIYFGSHSSTYQFDSVIS